MPAGDVALIRAGELHIIGPSSAYRFEDSDQFGIVSDTHVKWRGGKIPSAAEEPQVKNCLVAALHYWAAAFRGEGQHSPLLSILQMLPACCAC